MHEMIKQIEADFRKELEAYNTPETPAVTLLDEIKQKFLDMKLTIGDKPIPTFIKPYFLTKERMDYVRYAQNTMMTVIEKLALLYYTEPETRPWFRLNDAEIELAEIDRGWRRIVWITRNDAFMTDDWLKFIEFNTDSPGGPMYSDAQTRLVEETPVMQKVLSRWNTSHDEFIPQVLECLITAYRGWGGSKEKPNIAIVGGRGSATLPEFLRIIDWFREQGYNAEFTDPRDVEWDGRHCLANGMPIDVAYRRGWIKDWTDNMDEIRPLLEGYRAGALCVVNPPHSVLGSNKSLMEVFQRPEIQKKLYTDEEVKVIRDCVPWTRLMEKRETEYDGEAVKDIWEFARKNREKFVLKPFDQYGGKDVCIGTFVTGEKWDEYLEKTTKSLYVIQEYVPIPEEEFPVVEPEYRWMPKKVNVNFFAYNGIHAGGMVRTSDSAIINISAGGGLTPVIIVHGKK
jgi:hypothetical protein